MMVEVSLPPPERFLPSYPRPISTELPSSSSTDLACADEDACEEDIMERDPSWCSSLMRSRSSFECGIGSDSEPSRPSRAYMSVDRSMALAVLLWEGWKNE